MLLILPKRFRFGLFACCYIWQISFRRFNLFWFRCRLDLGHWYKPRVIHQVTARLYIRQAWWLAVLFVLQWGFLHNLHLRVSRSDNATNSEVGCLHRRYCLFIVLQYLTWLLSHHVLLCRFELGLDQNSLTMRLLSTLLLHLCLGLLRYFGVKCPL